MAYRTDEKGAWGYWFLEALADMVETCVYQQRDEIIRRALMGIFGQEHLLNPAYESIGEIPEWIQTITHFPTLEEKILNGESMASFIDRTNAPGSCQYWRNFGFNKKRIS